MTEDGVTGTGSGYNQSNAYAGGGNGVMGGYESLPNPVPASIMVYDHVARAIEPSFGGDATSFPATVNAGEVYSKTYTFTLPTSWDENNMHIIGMLIAPNGRIDNASKASFFDGLGVVENKSPLNKLSIYPNPSSQQATIAIDLSEQAQVELSVVDLTGKTLTERNYGSLVGTSTIEINTNVMKAGVYLVNVKINGVNHTERLVIR